MALDLAGRIGAMDPRQPQLVQGAWSPLPHQIPPDGDWLGWLLLAGRGAGKTDACANFVTNHVKGPPCHPGSMPHRIAIIAPTQGDAVDACVRGPSGLEAHDPTARLYPAAPGGTIVRWPNGSEAKLFGAHTRDDVERLRAGGNRCVAWLEELAAWRYLQESFDHMRFGLRIGSRPRWVASTTPKTRPLIKALKADAVARVPDAPGSRRMKVVLSTATIDDNPHLPAHIRQALLDAYAGRALGRQELLGELIDEDEGALWRRAWLDRGRLLEADLAAVIQDCTKITVAVDPSGGLGEQGIIVVGRGANRHGYVLADRSCALTPERWGRRAVQAWLDHDADDIVGEVNFGGDMVISTVNAAAHSLALEGRATASVPARKVTASRGKRVRAEPISALSEVDPPRLHIVGSLPDLEDQLCTWTPESGESPDRLDAMVWGAWHVGLATLGVVGEGAIGLDLAGRRLSQRPGADVSPGVVPDALARVIPIDDPRRRSPWR